MADYDKAHRALRALWKRRIEMGGGAACWRCGGLIPPGSKWHLGHDDRGRVHVGPEHPGCNVKAANELRAADARSWREQRVADHLGQYRRILAADPTAREHPDFPGLIVRDW